VSPSIELLFPDPLVIAMSYWRRLPTTTAMTLGKKSRPVG
jgi:hypothetical protein